MMFIAEQYWPDFHDSFVCAALLECMRMLPCDFFALEDYWDFDMSMRAYLNK
jgi:hypothetical protein